MENLRLSQYCRLSKSVNATKLEQKLVNQTISSSTSLCLAMDCS